MNALQPIGLALAVALATALLPGCGGGGSAAPLPSVAEPAGAGGVASASPARPVAPGTWVVLGSSTAAGAGATPSRGWATRLAEDHIALRVTLVNLARGGITTYAARASFSEPVPARPAPDPSINIDAALALRPALLILSFPTNDSALGYEADETVRNLLALRRAALAAGVSVVVLSTQPRDLSAARRAALPLIDTTLSAAVGECFVAVRSAMSDTDGRLAPEFDSGDGVHPNDAGHALILERVEATLQSGRCVQAPRAG